MNVTLAITCLLALLVFVSFYENEEEKTDLEAARGWRLRLFGDTYRYEEKQGDEWHHINFETIRNGHAIRGIKIKSPTSWMVYPDWASLRREEIVARIKEELPHLRIHTENTLHPMASPSADEPSSRLV